MKRKTRPPGLSFRKPSVRDNFSKEQLEAIGAVTMAYNDAEYELNCTLGSALGIAPTLWNDLATRINGAAGKKELISLTAATQKWPPAVLATIDETLIAFLEWKGYRDWIIHAQIVDKANAIAHPIQRQGASGEVLLTAKAVEGVYDRLLIVIEELKCLKELFEALSADKFVNGLGPSGSQRRREFAAQRAKRLEPKVQAYLAQVQAHQKARRSLPPLPKFPEPRVAQVEFAGGRMRLPYYEE